MLDSPLIQLFLGVIQAGLTAQGYAEVEITASYQPTQQGVDEAPTVYYHKIADKRYGFLGRSSQYDSLSGNITHTETQLYETTFQISTLVISDPSISSYDASDLANIVAMILQSDSAVDTFNAADVGIYRITDVRNPYFLDDKDRFEASPSFDFTLTHKQINTTIVPKIQTAVAGIYPV